jgi:hypothetical protein
LVPHLGVNGAIIATTTTELLGALIVAAIARRALPGSVPLLPWVALGVGALLGSFGALWAWRAVAPAVGVVAAVVGTTVALAPVVRSAVVSLREIREDGPDDAAVTWVGDDMR